MATLIEKQTVLVDGLDKLETRLHRAMFIAYNSGDYDAYDLAFQQYQGFLARHGKIPSQINLSRFKRVQRLRHHIAAIIKNGDAIFLTLTFSDDVLASTSASTRRTYVARFLKTVSTRYVANKDFGKTNEREHYHAIVCAGSVDYSLWRPYGLINGQRVRNQDHDVERTIRYVAKLTFHSIKKTASFERMIYSRKLK